MHDVLTRIRDYIAAYGSFEYKRLLELKCLLLRIGAKLSMRDMFKRIRAGIDAATPIEEMEFLPAALEVVETPPSPIGRAILWTIIGCTLFAIIWASLGEVEVVAVAQGRIIPSGQVKTIQPLEVGVVKHIAVEEGQHVEEGQLLVELDTTSSQADVERLSNDFVQAKCEMARIQALLSWNPSTGNQPRFVPPTGVNADFIALYKRRIEQEASSLLSQLAGLDNDLDRLEAQYQAATHRVQKMTETLPIITKRAEAFKKLYNDDTGSEQDWLLREQERIEVEQDLRAEQQQMIEAEAAIRSMRDKRAQTYSEFRRDLLQLESETKAHIETYSNDLVKATQRTTLQRLNAPVAGKVQQLAVHTVGGVVQEAQPLMVIVPDNFTMEVEARVLNKDIGFVYEGQGVEVKLEAFPFTEYGIIGGELMYISNDAIKDEQLGLVYLARVALHQQHILVNDKKIQMSPGMNVTAEIQIRKRRIISFFLSPLMKYTSESMRER